MHLRHRARSAIPALVFALFLAACSSGEASTDPPTTANPTAPASTLPAPAVTVVHSPAPPWAESLATSVPTPEGTLPATASPQLGPNNFPPEINPLTGLPMNDPALLDRRPVAIKVANSPRSARPQSGLSLADLVFEHIAEGGNSRFTAIFLGSEVERVGPIRSARLIDLELPAMYKAIFAYSGTSHGTRARIDRADFVTRAFSENGAGPGPAIYRVGPGSVNDLMANTAALQQLSLERANSGGRQDLSGLRFDSTLPGGGEPAALVNVRFSSETYAEWRFEAASGRYVRWADLRGGGVTLLTDALTRVPITAANVVVAFVPTFLTDILEDDQGLDPATGLGGHYGVEIQLWGSGPAIVFRDGQAYRVTWVRFEREGTLGFVLSGEERLPFKPGNTWVELVGVSTAQSAGEGTWTFEHKAP